MKPPCRFHYVGSAYQRGDSSRDVPEGWFGPAPPARFRNDYEHSKREAKIMLAGSPTARAGRAVVARLGIVVGHAETGRSLSDYGIYDFMRVMAFFARRQPHERVRLLCHPDANLHLVPIDVCVEWLLLLADCELGRFEPPIFHLVDGASVGVGDFFASASAHLPIDLVTATPVDLEREPYNRFESIVNMRSQYTAVYFREHYAFDRHNLLRLTGPQPPRISREVVDRLVGWFVREGLPAAESPVRVEG